MKIASLAPVRHGVVLPPRDSVSTWDTEHTLPKLPGWPAPTSYWKGQIRFGHENNPNVSTALMVSSGESASQRLLQVITAPQVSTLLSTANKLREVHQSPRLTSHHLVIAALQQAILELQGHYLTFFPNRLDKTEIIPKKIKQPDGQEIESKQKVYHFNLHNIPPIISGLLPESLYRHEIPPADFDLKKVEKILNATLKPHRMYVMGALHAADILSLLKTYNNWLLKAMEGALKQASPEVLEKEENALVRMLTALAAEKKADLTTADVLSAITKLKDTEARAVSPLFHQVYEALQNLREDAEAIANDQSDIEQMEAQVNQAFENGQMPAKVRRNLLSEIKRLEGAGNSSEAMYVRTWVRRATKLPWTQSAPRNIDLHQAKQILDRDHYGMEKVKKRILGYLASLKQNPQARPKILFLVGPPGVGKTSITKAIAEALGRNYVRRSVGGLTDEKVIKGHHRTYIGARHGMILDAMMEAGSTNPVFVLDEAEKLGGKGGDARVEATKATLLEILDPEQNSTYQDNYFEFPYSLNNVFFILTGNYKDKIPPALKDRVEVIELGRYDDKEKYEIAKRYLLPKVLKNEGFTPNELEITPDAIQKLIQGYTREPGVRQLEKKLGQIANIVSTKRQFSKNPQAYPKVTITEHEVQRNSYLGPAPFKPPSKVEGEIPGEVNGLAWTEMGGDTLPVEVNITPSRMEGLQGTVTGNVQEIMQESAQTAMGYLDPLFKAGQLKLKPEFQNIEGARVRLHFPQAAIPKDGPSAGVAMVSAMTSALTGIPLKSDVAMTGEIRLHGQVLAIGGLKEKIDAAYRAGIRTIFIPEENRRDLAKIPKEQLDKIEVIPVRHVDEILRRALAADPFLPFGESLNKRRQPGFTAKWA